MPHDTRTALNSYNRLRASQIKCALSSSSVENEALTMLELLPGRRRRLRQWRKGLISEVDIDSRQLLWSWTNNHAIGEQPGRLSVYTAKYINDVNFAMNAGLLSD
jgi:hypothetical protein